MNTSELVAFLDLNHDKLKIADSKFIKTTEEGNECIVQGWM